MIKHNLKYNKVAHIEQIDLVIFDNLLGTLENAIDMVSELVDDDLRDCWSVLLDDLVNERKGIKLAYASCYGYQLLTHLADFDRVEKIEILRQALGIVSSGKS